ncbi:ribonuclease H-like domain-containing protein, partial [Lentinula aff. detonsa]
FFGCVAEGCDWLQAGNAAKNRVLRHAAHECKHLSTELRKWAITQSAGGSLGSKLEPHTPSPSPACSSTLTAGPQSIDKPATKLSIQHDFTELGKKEWQDKLDFCIMKLICVNGLAPNILDSDEWKEFIQVATKSKLKATPSDKFEYDYIPNEAARVQQLTVEALRQHHNLTFTFDGSDTLGRDSVYTGHVTTPDRTTYFLSFKEGTNESHTAEWVKSFVLDSMDIVGREHFAGTCADSTGNTRKGRTLVKDAVPTVMALPDPCHHIHNTVKDITNLPEFQNMISVLRAVIKHFSHSNFGNKLLKNAQADDEVTKGLVKIGKTRFATHYSAAVALDRCFTNIQNLIVTKAIKPKNKEMVDTITGQRDSMVFKLNLLQYTRIVDPLARSLWSLEAQESTMGDVYLFYMAIGAELKDLFEMGEKRTGIDVTLAQKITKIFNKRYREFIDATPDDPYFTTLYLDPRFVGSDIFKKSGTIPTPVIVLPAAQPNSITDEAQQAPNPYRRAKKALLQLLRNEVQMFGDHKESSSIASLVKMTGASGVTIKNEFSVQLLAYSCREFPFMDPIGAQTVLQWWRSLVTHPKARVLAFLAVKLYSVLPNSMPDERWGSTKTRTNTPLRNHQKVSTLANMIQVGDWYGKHMVSLYLSSRAASDSFDVHRK